MINLIKLLEQHIGKLHCLKDIALKPIFEKYGYKNIGFTDGRDIYNFIKEASKKGINILINDKQISIHLLSILRHI